MHSIMIDNSLSKVSAITLGSVSENISSNRGLFEKYSFRLCLVGSLEFLVIKNCWGIQIFLLLYVHESKKWSDIILLYSTSLYPKISVSPSWVLTLSILTGQFEMMKSMHDLTPLLQKVGLLLWYVSEFSIIDWSLRFFNCIFLQNPDLFLSYKLFSCLLMQQIRDITYSDLYASIKRLRMQIDRL